MSVPDNAMTAALKAESTAALATPAGADRWGTRGRTITALSPFATEAGGVAEAARVAAFFSRPLVRDRVSVMGDARGVHKRCIRLIADGLDYAPAGELVFVLGVTGQDNGTSILTVLRRLG